MDNDKGMTKKQKNKQEKLGSNQRRPMGPVAKEVVLMRRHKKRQERARDDYRIGNTG